MSIAVPPRAWNPGKPVIWITKLGKIAIMARNKAPTKVILLTTLDKTSAVGLPGRIPVSYTHLSEGRGLKPMPGPERAQRRLSESDGKDSVGEAG